MLLPRAFILQYLNQLQVDHINAHCPLNAGDIKVYCCLSSSLMYSVLLINQQKFSALKTPLFAVDLELSFITVQLWEPTRNGMIRLCPAFNH